MLKVEGTAFRFLPDPVQIKNALESIRSQEWIRWSSRFPVGPSSHKEEKQTLLPIYFQKEDIEKALSLVSRASRGAALSQHILVGSLEVRKMEISKKNLGWEDLILIPPGKTHSQHIQEVVRDPRFESLCGYLYVDSCESVDDLNGRLALIDKELKSATKKRTERETTSLSEKMSEIQKQKLTEEFKELKESGKLELFIEKKRRRNAAKDHRYMPYRRPAEQGTSYGKA
ncbi:hypothetical protein OROMI_012255 [Orobanche minor]